MNSFLPLRLECRGQLAAVFLLAVGVTSHAIAQITAPGQQLPQSPYDPPYAAVTYPPANTNSQPVTVFTPPAGKIFALVGVQPGQTVNVVVQYPANQTLQLVNLEALDGGTIAPPIAVTAPGTPQSTPSPSIPPLPSPPPQNSPTSVIPTDNNGTLTFAFIAGSSPGLYRITLTQGSQTLRLEFWAFDSTNPQGNPGCITATTPNY